MSKEQYSDHCEGCRPAIMDIDTHERLPDDSPTMLRVFKVWDTETTYEQRVVWHRVMCLNSRTTHDLRIAKQLADALGGDLAASRPICDSGWLPMDRQIGSSAKRLLRSCIWRSASVARSSTSSE